MRLSLSLLTLISSAHISSPSPSSPPEHSAHSSPSSSAAVVESGLAKLLVAQVREAKHVKQEARLVHVPELLLRPGKPRKALLKS